jgi:hypothetical protein
MASTFREIVASADLTTTVRYVRGVYLAENAGTPAEARVLLRDGSSSGMVLMDLRIPASTSKEVSVARPLYFPNGCYVHVTAGTVRGGVDGD